MMGIGTQLASNGEIRQDDKREDYIMKQIEKGKPVRAPHKFHQKIARTKGNRGQQAADGGDGGMLAMGKRGGVKPASMQS